MYVPRHVRRLASTGLRCGTVLSGVEMDMVLLSLARMDETKAI
jgi:hypothetical protein